MDGWMNGRRVRETVALEADMEGLFKKYIMNRDNQKGCHTAYKGKSQNLNLGILTLKFIALPIMPQVPPLSCHSYCSEVEHCL